MFRRKDSKPESPPNKENDGMKELPIKYPKPHILLMDTDSHIGKVLKNAGFETIEGSFGAIYKFPRERNKLVQLFLKHSIPPNLHEMEIIIVDLSPNIHAEPIGEPLFTDQGDPLMISAAQGIADTRPLMMNSVGNDFQKILNHDGIIIIFADSKQSFEYFEHKESRYDNIQTPIELNTWAFVEEISRGAFSAEYQVGKEIEVESNTIFSSLLRKYVRQATFHCHIDAHGYLKERWRPLAFNKHNEAVAGAIKQEDSGGWIIVFPHFEDKSSFLLELLTSVLPELQPTIFPYFESRSWITNPEYELPQVIKLSAEIDDVQKETKNRIATIQERIDQERSEKWYFHALLTETGDRLVSAVEISLKLLGFKEVVDIDHENSIDNIREPKREDLQIRDKSPLLLIEVKGIGNITKDADAVQVAKYIATRTRQLNRTDIRGLSIVNHQRNLDPLDRDDIPFSDDALNSAEDYQFGLLTTWDLFRLLRNFENLKWKHAQITELFYQNGFISIIPSHYQEIGIIERLFEEQKVIGIHLEKSNVNLGDRIAFELHVEFKEQTIESLQINGTPADFGEIGTRIGISTPFTIADLKVGTRVFCIVPTD